MCVLQHSRPHITAMSNSSSPIQALEALRSGVGGKEENPEGLNRDESKGLIHNKRYLLSWPHKARGHRLFYRRQEALFLEKHTEHA